MCHRHDSRSHFEAPGATAPFPTPWLERASELNKEEASKSHPVSGNGSLHLTVYISIAASPFYLLQSQSQTLLKNSHVRDPHSDRKEKNIYNTKKTTVHVH